MTSWAGSGSRERKEEGRHLRLHELVEECDIGNPVDALLLDKCHLVELTGYRIFLEDNGRNSTGQNVAVSVHSLQTANARRAGFGTHVRHFRQLRKMGDEDCRRFDVL